MLRHLSSLRSFHSSSPALAKQPLFKGIQDFFDVTRKKGEPPVTGRAWTCKELRKKSFEDLHKLWFVLYKERNMLLTERNHFRRNNRDWEYPDRKRKVMKSMASIKRVVDERTKIYKAKQQEVLEKEESNSVAA
mmetsp:Transcript_24712/g.32263  ORF Transcript_24712/g.32263 Transcript_24712/m.32263 type:complete len:134 (+) Transcript_24712:83-484(+)